MSLPIKLSGFIANNYPTDFSQSIADTCVYESYKLLESLCIRLLSMKYRE